MLEIGVVINSHGVDNCTWHKLRAVIFVSTKFGVDLGQRHSWLPTARPSPPAGAFPGTSSQPPVHPPPTAGASPPDLGRFRASSSFLPPFPPQQAKVRKNLPTCRFLGVPCGRGTHGSLPVKCGALLGPASEWPSNWPQWGALGSPDRAGDRWRPRWRPG